MANQQQFHRQVWGFWPRRWRPCLGELGLCLYLLSPFLILSFVLGRWGTFDSSEFAEVGLWAFLQALVSAAISLTLGFFAGLGLIGLRRSWFFWLAEAVALFPNLVPALFILLAVFNFTHLFSYWPQGWSAVVGFHVLINLGLVAVVSARILEDKMGGMAELALVEGASLGLFLRKGVWGNLRRELFLLGFFVFAVSFSSFAVPMVIGGARGRTIEVLIYEKVRFYQSWPEALSLSLAYILLLFIMATFVSSRVPLKKRRQVSLKLLERPVWSLLFVLPTVLVCVGLLLGIGAGWRQLMNLKVLWPFLLPAAGYSLVVSLIVGMGVTLLLYWVSYLWPSRALRSLLLGYFVPSTVIVGFSLFFVPGWSEDLIFLKLLWGLILINFPACYRLLGDGPLLALRGQVEVAQTLGASPRQIFSWILRPQLAQAFCMAGFLASVWACGDFALSGMVAERDLTLALAVKTLMSAYRIEIANLLVCFMLGLCFLLFFFWRGVALVLGARSNQRLW